MPTPAPELLEPEPRLSSSAQELAVIAAGLESLLMARDLVIRKAIREGLSYGEIARAAGLTRQSVHEKYRHLR